MFIEGKRGLGKSTFGNKIAYLTNAKFNPKQDIAFSRDDVIKLLGQKTKGIILADELINVAYNRDFWDQDQKTLIKALNMYRDKCNLFIGCIPSFVDLDKQMQKLCKIRITILRRGYALLQIQTRTLYSNDPWDVNTNRKIEQKFKTGKMKYSKFSTVKGIIKFSDLTSNQRELYESIKEEKRGQVFEQYNGETEEKKPIDKLFERIQREKISIQTFELTCNILGLKSKSVRNQLNEMIRDNALKGTLKDYIVEESILVKEKIKASRNKRAKKFDLIARESKVLRNTPPPETSKDDHNTMKYGKGHLWAR